MLPLFVLAAIAAIAPASAELARRPLNVSITDNSPLLVYKPEIPRPEENATRSGMEHQSWNVTFSGSSWAEWTPNRVGHGDSEHRTSWQNATVSFSWMGTGVRFLGRLEGESRIEMRLVQSSSAQGGEVSYTEEGTLASLYVEYGWHTAQIVLRSGTVVLTGVEFMTEIETMQESADETLKVDVSARDGDGISPLIPNLQGSNTPGGKAWHVHDVICTSDDPVHFPRMDTWDKDAWATMAVPRNASYFTFWGSMNDDHRQYSLEIIPPAPGLPEGPQVFSGYSSWCTPDTLMYAAPLDPAERYRIRVINLVNDRVTDIKKATFWIANDTSATEASASASPEASSSAGEEEAKASLSPAAIAGIALGGVAVLGAVALSVFLLLHRRKAQETAEQYDLDENKHLVHRRARSWGSSVALSRGSGWTDSSSSPVAGRGEGHRFHGGPGDPPVTATPAASARQRHTYASHTPQSSVGFASLGSINEDSLYVTDTDAGTLPVLMPPTYDPEWANARPLPPPPPLSARTAPQAEEEEGTERAGAPEPRPQPAQQYIGRNAHTPLARTAHRSTHDDPRREHRTSGQVTELLSELWGAPLQRNGSTWKPVRPEGANTPRSEAFTEISLQDAVHPREPRSTASPSDCKNPRAAMNQREAKASMRAPVDESERKAKVRASRQGNYI